MEKGYLLLLLSILPEVFSTQMMKLSGGFTRTIPAVLFAAGMASCFYAFSKTLTILGIALIIAGVILLNLRG